MTYPNLNILTYNANIIQVAQDYYSPVAMINGSVVSSIYAFLGRVDPWPTDGNGVEIPVQPTQTQSYIRQTFKNMFALKALNTNNISPVLQRIDWTSGNVYIPYSDVVDILAKDTSGNLVYQFYVRNRYDQVFKCLWNSNGAPSTNEPFFQPGSYGTNNIFQSTDGYKWKYIYTIDKGAKKAFMDTSWMPVPLSPLAPTSYGSTGGTGDIEVINVTNGGLGYDPVNTYITITVTGDGSGVTANVTSAQINVAGSLQDIIISTPGKNYTNANVAITAYTSSNLQFVSATGNGATAIAPISPIGGHAFSPIAELGCSNVMFVAEFNGSEGGAIPNDPQYRQVGLLINPSDYSSFPGYANNAIYNNATQIQVAAGQGLYNGGASCEVVQQTNTQGAVTFSGTVLSFNSATNILQVINTTGTFTVGQSITGVVSGCTRTVMSVSLPNLVPFTGYLAYIENRAGVQRSPDGIEQFKFLLNY